MHKSHQQHKTDSRSHSRQNSHPLIALSIFLLVLIAFVLVNTKNSNRTSDNGNYTQGDYSNSSYQCQCNNGACSICDEQGCRDTKSCPSMSDENTEEDMGSSSEQSGTAAESSSMQCQNGNCTTCVNGKCTTSFGDNGEHMDNSQQQGNGDDTGDDEDQEVFDRDNNGSVASFFQSLFQEIEDFFSDLFSSR